VRNSGLSDHMPAPFLHILNAYFNHIAAQHGIAADRFAREIGAILKISHGALAAADGQAVRPLRQCGSQTFFANRARFANACPAGSVVPVPVVLGMIRRPVVQCARCAAVVRRPVLRRARCGERDRVLGVVPTERLICRA
jgi:hypothetical protein